MDIKSIKEELLLYMDPGGIRENEPMSEHTSFRCGGAADLYVAPENLAQLLSAAEVLSRRRAPYVIVGKGSNLLFRDGGYRGVALKIGEGLDRVRFEGDTVFAEPGIPLGRLSRMAAKAGLSGLEFGCGIPGSLGGAVFMNAGAYGQEMRDRVFSVSSVNAAGMAKDRKGEDCGFSYRHSCFMETGEIIIGVKLKLERELPERIEKRMEELMEMRNAKQPVNMPCAGSFFRRPEGNFAGKLIDEAGLKGLRIGGAQVSPMHAGFIVNAGGASASDVIDLMKVIRETLAHKFGVVLEPEVRIVGEE